ncbi:MAG: CPBP family intramembrane glutamic endopeptidase [Planctomycetota bacterium]
MTPPPAQLSPYRAQTHKPLANLVFVAPLLAAYEVSVALGGTDLLSRSHLQRFLSEIGAGAEYFSALLIVAVLLAQQIAGKHPWRLPMFVPALMVLEAVLLAVPLLGLGLLGNHAVATAGARPGGEVVHLLLACIGAGIYEEFLFRLAWLAVAGLLLVDLLSLPKDVAVAVAVLTSALAFALYHFTGPAPVAWPAFAFFALSGTYLAGVYLLRGYGVAVGAHVVYNVVVLAISGAGR